MTYEEMIVGYQTQIRELQEVVRLMREQVEERDVLIVGYKEQVRNLITIANDLREMVERNLGRSIIH